MSFTKRPGFEREEVVDINSIVYTNPTTGEEVGRVSLDGTSVDADGNLYLSTVQDLPPVRTKIQTEFLHRDMLLVEAIKDLVAEQRRTNFLLERISGVDIDVEVFKND